MEVSFEEDEQPRRSKRPTPEPKKMRGKAPLPGATGPQRAVPSALPRNYAPLGGGFLLAVVFPFLAVTMLVPSWTGSLGQAIEAGLFAFSGSTSLLVPLLVLSLAMHFLLPRQRRPIQMTWAPVLLWFNLVIVAQRMGSQGGKLGAAVDGVLTSMVGPVGSWLICLACVPLCLLAVCRVHPQEAGHALANLLHTLQDKIGELFVWLHLPKAEPSVEHYEEHYEESVEIAPRSKRPIPVEESLEEISPGFTQPYLHSIEMPAERVKAKTSSPAAKSAPVEDSWEEEHRLPFEEPTPPGLAQSREFPGLKLNKPAAPEPIKTRAPREPEKITFYPEILEPISALEPLLAPPPAPRPVAKTPAPKAPASAAKEPSWEESVEPTLVSPSAEPTLVEYSPSAESRETSVEPEPSQRDDASVEEDYEDELEDEEDEVIEEEALASFEDEDFDPEASFDVPVKPRAESSISPEFLESNGQIRLFAEEPKAPVAQYRLPPLALLNDAPMNRDARPPEDKSENLIDALASFGVAASLLAITRGPAVTRYELQPARGVKVSRFTSLTNDIALALAATAVRIEAPIPGKSAIGIEIPNEKTDLVVLKDIMASSRFRKSAGMSIALGKDLGGNPTFTNLQKMPHLLVAGTTGSGKSVCVNGLILSLIYRFSPRQLQLLMIDPKQVELSIYEGIPHLISLSRTPEAKNEGAIICDPKRAAMALHQIVELMEYRYGLFAAARVRNLEEFNDASDDPLPWVVVIIDELADLMMVAAKTVETSICRIAQKARAAGIHLVLATQRPSADVITGLIKVNVPSRIAFAVSSQVDSRVILDTGGAEQLLGKGDMLFCPVDASDPLRVQGCYVTNEEILRVVEWWKAQACPENLIKLQATEVAEEGGDDEEGDADDALVEQALSVVVRRQQASASLLQTELKVGYARARRLIYLMEKKGYIGPAEGSKPRKILYSGVPT